MSDGRREDEAPLFEGGELSDERLAQALPAVAARQAADPDFRARLGQRLLAAASARAAVDAHAGAPAPRRPSRRPLLMAAGAFAAAAALVGVLAPRRGALPAMAPAVRTLAADEPVRLRAPAGVRVGVALAAAGRASQPLARLELRDGAEVSYRPGDPAELELRNGFVRVATTAPLRLRAAGQELVTAPHSDVSLELRLSAEGENTMRPVWLIPTSAASGAALTLAVLVLQGRVELTRAARGAPATPPTGQVLVLHPDEDGPQTLAQAQRRITELEQKVSALKQESGRYAGQLAQKKGVTTASVLERISALKRSPYAAMLAPGALADLMTDLKGLGPAGVEAMIGLLKSTDANERFLAGKLLEDLNAPSAIPALRQAALNDDDKMAATMAGHALALMDDASTVPALREIADANKNWEARVNALWGLCKHGDQRAIGEALAYVKDEKQSPQARAALGANLMLLSDPELLPIVDETVRQFGDAGQLATIAANYYKSLGTPEARERLEAMARNQKLNEAYREAARKALAPAPR
jgi:HEAT repeat protein